MRVQQLEDVFGILRSNFRAWFQLLGLEAEDILRKNLQKI